MEDAIKAILAIGAIIGFVSMIVISFVVSIGLPAALIYLIYKLATHL